MIIDCKRIADKIELEPKERTLGILRHGESEDAENFCKGIMIGTEKNKIRVIEMDISGQSSLRSAMDFIDFHCDKIVYCNPFPPEIKERLRELMPLEKDIDNFTGRSKYKNCTAEAVRMVLEEHYKSIEGLNAVVLGANVGWEIARELKDMRATVTVCNSKTKDIPWKLKSADIIVSAVGKKDLLKDNMVNDSATIIDVGNDVSAGLFQLAETKLMNIDLTPQRNGIGLITTKILLKKVLED